ncbi:hypothetical protein BKG71_22845 [Mycobacteroides chelonae]|uniref:hypothetical protein n=1 Tax=Mycobacteroides chelonae TaxID=1774 RepID=UPI0008A920B9|nr:hypothetical protein [Mycobacteroides chelonae]OHT95536.1 hypothetical protein BKG71_22845 [Mycobacteroides chelonae]
MKFWSVAPEPKPERGFAAAMNDLIARKQRELAPKWDNLPERQRRSKARERALSEMARRIEARTGRRYAPSTLARKAAKDQLPGAVDDQWLVRWAQVDRAGSVEKLAKRFGRTESQLARWRDQPPLKPGEKERPIAQPKAPAAEKPAPPRERPAPAPAPSAPAARPPTSAEDQLEFDLEGGGPYSIGIDCEGYFIGDGKAYRKQIPTDGAQEYEWLAVDADTQLELYDAWMANDIEQLGEILSPLITDQVISTWPYAPPGSYFTIDDISSIHFPADPNNP